MKDNYQDDRPWTGYDLDGTLAFSSKIFDPFVIGDPVQPMVEMVSKQLARGERVKIFTARVSLTGQRSPVSGAVADRKFIDVQHKIISTWLVWHIGCDLEITSVKDALCIRIYDDRAYNVVENKGIVIGEPDEIRN